MADYYSLSLPLAVLPEYESSPTLVLPTTPIAMRKRVELFAKYFKREMHFDFPQFEAAETPDKPWFTLMVGNHEDSPTLRAFLMGNSAIQIGLFQVEILAYREGTITTLSGIVPNSIIHLCLAAGFIYYIVKMPRQNTA
jgi:hypothetical protein